MTGLGSIIWRELAVGARQASTHRGRFIAGAIVVAFFTLFLAVQNQPPQVLGMMIFSFSSLLLFIQALLSGVRYTADALSEEKREGTLGLLFLTELRSVEVVLGKMAARSLRGFYAMIATLPIFTFCILLGGIRGVDALNMALLLLVTMLFSLAAGIYISSRTTEDKAAFLGTLGFIFALCALPPVVWKMFSAATRSGYFDFILYVSPFYAFQVMPRTTALNTEFVRTILSLVFLSGILIFLSTRHLAQSFKQQFNQATETTKPIAHRAASAAISSSRLNRLLESNPFAWLLARDHLYQKINFLFTFVAFCGVLVVSMLLSKFGPGKYLGLTIYSAYLIHLFWKILVASDALRRLHHDRRSGALEQILVTPLPVKEITCAQLKRLSVFVPSAIAISIGNFILWRQPLFSNLGVIAFGGAVFLFIDARTLTWQAMLQALKPRRYPIAILTVVGATLLPPILIMLLFLVGRGFSGPDPKGLFFFWFIGCAIYDAILIQSAKAKLKRFRELASELVRPSKSMRPLPKPLRWLLLLEPIPANNAVERVS